MGCSLSVWVLSSSSSLRTWSAAGMSYHRIPTRRLRLFLVLHCIFQLERFTLGMPCHRSVILHNSSISLSLLWASPANENHSSSCRWTI